MGFKRKSEASRRYHNRVAGKYDRIYEDAYWEFHDELTWRAVKGYLPRDLSEKCLDLGCGTGKWGLRLLKTGFATTFVDHSAGMIEQTRAKVEPMGAKGKKATLVVGDIVDLSMLEGEQFGLAVAMGDPLSICSDPAIAVREMWRVLKPGGVVIATADSKLAAVDHFLEKGDLEGLEAFVRTSRTHWLTEDSRERFELTMFTPGGLRGLFEKAGFEVVSVVGKTVLPVRRHKAMLEREGWMERLLRVEGELAKDETAAGKASHLQVTARRPNAEAGGDV
jgi:ubiquinone/menaquinone biosynthesis C-methylase UbiE